MPSSLVKISSMYAAIYDERSPVNIKGFMKNLLAAAMPDPRCESLCPGGGLFVFNQHLINRMQQGELLAWGLALDGIFQYSIQQMPQVLLAQENALYNTLGCERLTANLKCPSGRLHLSCMGELGNDRSPTICLEPGTYNVSIARDSAIENEHYLIQRKQDYIFKVRPDWLIQISSVLQPAHP